MLSESLLSSVLRGVLSRIGWRATRQFDAAARRPAETQWALLSRILHRERNSGFGRDHHFRSVRKLDDFRRHVPITDYDYARPYVERVKNGETTALFARQRVVMFSLTSGTTQSRKFVPVTKEFLKVYKRAWYHWGLHTFLKYERLLFAGKVSLVGDAVEFRTPAGIPCGSLSGLTTQMQNPVIRRTYCLPAEASRIADTPTKYYLAWRLSLPRDVGMWLSPNPSTHVALACFGTAHAERLIRDVADGGIDSEFAVDPAVYHSRRQFLKPNPQRARELQRCLDDTGSLRPKDVWPDLGLIGCWLGGTVGSYLRFFPDYFGDVPVRDLGLIASEARMTVPTEDGTAAGPLEITGTFFEFVPVDEIDHERPTVLQAHELMEGGEYFILLTTSGGLYRYNIRDVVRCVGWYERTPVLMFLHKGSGISNLTGEKLTEFQVVRAVAAAECETGLRLGTFSLAPCWEQQTPYYAAFVETDCVPTGAEHRFAAVLDRQLRAANCEYDSKRASGRLGAPRIARLPAGSWQRWDRQRLKQTGGSAEQYKHPCLITDLDFACTMPVLERITDRIAAG